ncbi:MAG: amidohydrolase [Leptolyngbyaceae cyanobacterium RU_5_1]|nr:amidohydrolase [Leptolyngbyaceae cyanobacterium RU_5_1]
MDCTVIRNAVVFTVNPQHSIYPNGAIVLRDDRIEAVGSADDVQIPADVTHTIDCHGRMVVIPGLIDVHSHSSLLRGVTENLQLLEWLPRYQLEHRALTEEDAYYAALLCYLEALKAGTTCVMDMFRYMHRCAEAAGVLGLRVNLVPYSADLPDKNFFETPETNRKLIETHHLSQNGRVRVWVGLEHLFYCSKDAYAKAREYANHYDVRIHTHTSEQREEVDAVVKHFGKRPIELFNDLGILGPKTAIAHCVWLNNDEIKLLADTGTSVAHCPISNAKLAGGIAPILKLKQAGITIGLGTDGIISNNSLDLFEEMKFASLLQKVNHYDAAALPAPEVLRMATIEGARLLGLDHEIGSLEPGKKADVVLIDLWQPNLMPLVWDNDDTNILWNLVYAARGSNVHTVFVDGQMVVQAGRSTRVEEPAILGAVQTQTLDHLKRREPFKSTSTPVVA